MTQIPSEYYERAALIGISNQTLYNRVNRGWDLEAAATTPPDHKKESLRRNSRFYGVPRGKVRTVRMPLELEEVLNEAIASSGLTEMDFLTEIVASYLERQEEKGIC